MGKDLLYLVSSSGNYKGAKWLQSVLGNDYKVHVTDSLYRASHLELYSFMFKTRIGSFK